MLETRFESNFGDIVWFFDFFRGLEVYGHRALFYQIKISDIAYFYKSRPVESGRGISYKKIFIIKVLSKIVHSESSPKIRLNCRKTTKYQ